MRCPNCGSDNHTVTDSRYRQRGWVRNRVCLSCRYRFKTIERYSYDTMEEVLEMEENKPRLTAKEEQKKENVRRIKELAQKLNIKLQD